MKKLLLLGLLAISSFGLEIQNGTLVTGVNQSLSFSTEPLPVVLKTEKNTYLGESKTNISSNRISIRLVSKCSTEKCYPIKGYVAENGVYGVEGNMTIDQTKVNLTGASLYGILQELAISNDPEIRKLYRYYQTLYFDAVSGVLDVRGNKPVQIIEY